MLLFEGKLKSLYVTFSSSCCFNITPTEYGLVEDSYIETNLLFNCCCWKLTTTILLFSIYVGMCWGSMAFLMTSTFTSTWGTTCRGKWSKLLSLAGGCGCLSSSLLLVPSSSTMSITSTWLWTWLPPHSTHAYPLHTTFHTKKKWSFFIHTMLIHSFLHTHTMTSRLTNTDVLVYCISVEWFCMAVMAALHIKCYLIIQCVPTTQSVSFSLKKHIWEGLWLM